MAPFSNFISFLFLTTLLFSLQINARDSQFFSKVTHVNNNNNNKVKESELPQNEGPVNKPEQQPAFIPETENSYGLYGHDSGLKTPSTTTTTTINAAPYTTTNTYQPYKTESEDTNKYPTTINAASYTTTNTYKPYKTLSHETSKYPNNNNYYNYNKDTYSTKQNELSDTRLAGTSYSNNNNYYNKDAYGNKQNELSDTKYTEERYNSMENQNNQKYYFNNAANDRQYYNNNNNNNGANDRYNGESQGLSDTRFMEGGKYFYEANSKKYNPTLYGGSTRGVNSENWYNNKGYFGNNNANSYEKKNSMEGYKNREEFEDDQDNFEP